MKPMRAAVQNEIKEVNEELEQVVNEIGSLEDLYQSLVKEHQTTDKLLEARKELIAGFGNISGGRSLIGLKRMGEITARPFLNVCKVRFPPSEAEDFSEAEVKALELCSLWQERLQNPDWFPFKIVMLEGGKHQELIDDDDELLKNLKVEWGVEIYKAVVTALNEMNEYNPIGRHVVSELWNFKEKRKATLKEAIAYNLKSWKKMKR